MKDCGGKPGQLTKSIRAAKGGQVMDCMARVMARSMGKEGVVLTRIVKVVNAPTMAISPIMNKYVRYRRAGVDVTSAFAACWAESLAF